MNGNWNLGASETYHTGSGSGARTLLFSAIGTLQGNTAIDTFNITAPTTEILNGGAGNDVFNLGSTLNGSVNGESGIDTLTGSLVDFVTLTGADINGFSGLEDSINAGASTGFTGIDNLIGNGGSLTGQDAVSVWNLDGTPTYESGGFVLDISGFTNLHGGSAQDTFNVTANSMFNLFGGLGNDLFVIDATLTGTLDGEGDNDTLTGTKINEVVLTGSTPTGFTGTEEDITGGFAGIDTLIGNGGTLKGENVDSIWLLDGTPTYFDGTNTLDISGFENLQGGSGKDQFLVTADSTFNLLGGAGADLFVINAVLNGSLNGEGTAPANRDTLQGSLINEVILLDHTPQGFTGFEPDIRRGFFGIDTIIGNGGRITGQNLASTWGLDGTPTYTQAGQVLDFSGFATLQGGSGADTFNVTASSTFELRGGDGNDLFTFVSGKLHGTADGEAGNDLLNGTGATAGLTLLGGTGNDTIIGTNFKDSLNGGDGHDSITGMGGDDSLTGGNGNDTIDGGPGNDCLIEFLDFPKGSLVLTNTSLVGLGTDKLSNIEKAVLFGNDEDNFIDASKFTMIGGVELHGGAGNDTLIGSTQNDLLDGGDGIDMIKQSAAVNQSVSNTNASGNGNDSLLSIEIAALTNTNTLGRILDATMFSGSAILTGGIGNDTLLAGTGSSTLIGGAGNDSMLGGIGFDVLDGGAGNDKMDGGAGNDTLRGGDGNDVLKGGLGDDRLFGDKGNDQAYGGLGQDLIDGGDGNDTLLGEAGHDSIYGGLGNDALRGGDGDDLLDGGAGNDIMIGDTGNDTIRSGGGNDKIIAGAGNDRIEANGSVINTGSGNDLVIGTLNTINQAFSFDFDKLLALT